MDLVLLMRYGKRCGATSKRPGKECGAPAVKGWNVCRFHGAGGGAPRGNKNTLKHGQYSAAAIQERRHVQMLCRASRQSIAEAGRSTRT
jgi:uncharacterized protein YjcR